MLDQSGLRAHSNHAPWWQTATGYQIYPASFADTNGDGIGDIPGIIGKLDHLADLGIGFIWLSPVYRSPQRDNGYDISDYYAIDPRFGTMEDMERLIAEAKARGIGIVMDLVVNHTSDQHPWFQAALSAPNAPERDFYVWRDAGPDGGPPSDLQACFGGPAWNWSEAAGQYFLGYFSPWQPDLNWQNPALRAAVWRMMNWWLDKGLAGFRMDVISLIGKDVDAGVFEQGPDLHRFLAEMRAETLKGRDIVTIGESWSVTRDTALLYCGRESGTLDMVFQFNHVTERWDDRFGKFRPKPRDLPRFKRVLADWQETLAEDGWNSLFLSNHDLPRHVSIYGDDGAHRVRSARMLAITLHMMKGTPFVYQGEEIGMTNSRFDSIAKFRDLETLRLYEDHVRDGLPAETFLEGASANSRDNSRTPMQWTNGIEAGFTTGSPWIDVNPNHTEVNVAADAADPDGVMATYRTLIGLRRTMPVVSHGRFRLLDADHPSVFAYTRTLGDARILVVTNFSAEPQDWSAPDDLVGPASCLVSSTAPRTEIAACMTLAPWEGFAMIMA